MAIRYNFSVVAAVVSDEKGRVLAVCASKPNSVDINEGEAYAALLASRLANSIGSIPLLLEGDFLIIVQALKNPNCIADWKTCPTIRDTLYST